MNNKEFKAAKDKKWGTIESYRALFLPWLNNNLRKKVKCEALKNKHTIGNYRYTIENNEEQ